MIRQLHERKKDNPIAENIIKVLYQAINDIKKDPTDKGILRSLTYTIGFINQLLGAIKTEVN
jgi:hypothetical protein